MNIEKPRFIQGERSLVIALVIVWVVIVLDIDATVVVTPNIVTMKPFAVAISLDYFLLGFCVLPAMKGLLLYVKYWASVLREAKENAQKPSRYRQTTKGIDK